MKANNNNVKAKNNDTKVGGSSIKASNDNVKEKIIMQREEKTQNNNKKINKKGLKCELNPFYTVKTLFIRFEAIMLECWLLQTFNFLKT